MASVLSTELEQEQEGLLVLSQWHHSINSQIICNRILGQQAHTVHHSWPARNLSQTLIYKQQQQKSFLTLLLPGLTAGNKACTKGA